MTFFSIQNMLEQPQTGLIGRFYRQVKNRPKKQVPKTFFCRCFESCLELKLNNNSWKKLGSTLKWLLYTWLFNFQTEGPPTALWWKTEFSENLLIEKKNKLWFNVGFNWIFDVQNYSMFIYLLPLIFISSYL